VVLGGGRAEAGKGGGGVGELVDEVGLDQLGGGGEGAEEVGA
jgi:hypothetical protein